ncbi:MAG: signal transduction family protein (GGDEF domain-containing protein) [Comamonadaceae bacterium]|nr:MAG: signal transduction family protein (GGDEF domain-containing protein) [Comamonadaceae bacterium]
MCVDDDITILNALRTLLSKQLDRNQVVVVAESGAEALEIISELGEDGIALSAVISDYIMPGMKGDELLVQLHQLLPQAFKIMLTGQSDLQGVKRAINEANLYRFLEKPFNNTDLTMTVQGATKAFRQEQELERSHLELKRLNEELAHHNALLEQAVQERTQELLEKNRELEHLSTTDRLTGLCNRMRLDAVVAEEIARNQRYQSPFSVILLDIDKFKSVNDSFGHQAGDSLLIEIAQVLGKQIRVTDVVGRWGGEEFLVVCRESPLDVSHHIAEKLRQAIERIDFAIVGGRTASFGLAAYQAGESAHALLARADQALYRAKNLGRNRVEVAD